jgi:hypothetical protein
MDSKDMEGCASAAGLARIVSRREVPERDQRLNQEFAGIAKRVRTQRKAVGGLGSAWEASLRAAGIHEQVYEKTTLVGLSRGVLTVRVADAATKFILDRFLRSGGEKAVGRLAGVGLQRIKTFL